MPESVRIVTLPDGESIPVLVESGRAPALETIRYAISMLRNAGRAEGTIEAHMRAIAIARQWARANGLSLEARMAAGAGLEVREIESLSRTLRTARLAKPADGRGRSNVLPFPGSGDRRTRRASRTPNPMLAPQTGANRVGFVAGYLEWLASHSRADGARSRLRGTVEALNARSRVRRRRTSHPRKGLSAEQRERLFAVVDPSSPENPFKSDAARYRNLAVVACLDQSGMRRGEIAGLKIGDVDFRKLTIAIHRRPPDPRDPRREKPRTKTNARLVPIRAELADILFDYISVWRRAEPGARMHGYLFVSHGGTRPGAPLSPRSLGKIFDALQLGFDLHAHMLRHTWNDRFSAAVDRKADSGGQTAGATEERIRNFLMGWSASSKMAEGYSRRHVERAARDALNRMHEGLFEGE